MSIFFHHFECDDGLHTCIVEDDGRVAYAYLTKEGNIISDLWLYNQADTPADPEWHSPAKMPFLNPRGHVMNDAMESPLLSSDDIKAEWKPDHGGEPARVSLYLRGRLYGVLSPMAKPGWCVAASKDGPLARRLTGQLAVTPANPAR